MVPIMGPVSAWRYGMTVSPRCCVRTPAAGYWLRPCVTRQTARTPLSTVMHSAAGCATCTAMHCSALQWSGSVEMCFRVLFLHTQLVRGVLYWDFRNVHSCTCSELAAVADNCLADAVFVRSQNVWSRSELADLPVFLRPATWCSETVSRFCSRCPAHQYDVNLLLWPSPIYVHLDVHRNKLKDRACRFTFDRSWSDSRVKVAGQVKLENWHRLNK